ncbi:cobyrinate a,c-diamide synthase, partial [Rhizobium sp. BR5]
MTARAIIIGAPRSGSGKTSVTIGLLRAFARRGVKVRGIKTGPDYIDPGFHAFATGTPGLNLDSWAMQPDLLRHLFSQQTDGAELVLIESAMGLFDGIPVAENRTGSAADLARLFGIPVLLVLDVSGQSQTAAAVAYGFAHYDPAVTMGAVVLNRAGSERHRTLCTEAIEKNGLPVAGCVLRDPSLILPERHLGLVQASEHPEIDAHIDRLADAMEKSIDLDAL